MRPTTPSRWIIAGSLFLIATSLSGCVGSEPSAYVHSCTLFFDLVSEGEADARNPLRLDAQDALRKVPRLIEALENARADGSSSIGESDLSYEAVQAYLSEARQRQKADHWFVEYQGDLFEYGGICT